MKTTYFMLPGMFSPFINCFLGTYFIDQMEYLRERNHDYLVLPLQTEGVIDLNARIIREHALRFENIVAFTHSKGGVDLLHALLIYPEIRERFQKIIFMQAPFFGTPLADVAHANQGAELITKSIFTLLLRGNPQSAKELKTQYRELYMKTYHSEIQDLLRTMDITCIASAKSPERGRFDSILKIPRDFMDLKYKLPNDGMVPKKSAIIPGANLREFQDLDHASAVIRLTPQHFDRKLFSREIFHGGT